MDRILEGLKIQCDNQARKRTFLLANYSCENCGITQRNLIPPNRLEWSHFIGRGNWGIRWNRLNNFCFCTECHQHFDRKDVIAFQNFVHNKIGDMGYSLLHQARAKYFKRSRENLIEVKKELYNELNLIRTGRHENG